jgi:hypothetical protein
MRNSVGGPAVPNDDADRGGAHDGADRGADDGADDGTGRDAGPGADSGAGLRVDLDAGLSWSRTVPRALVHRTSPAEVLLTDVRAVGAGGAGGSPGEGRGDGGEVGGAGLFRAAAFWPRSHATFPAEGGDLHSALLVVETLRQLGIYLPLRWYGVPPTAQLLIDDLFFALRPGGEPLAGHGGTEVGCSIRVTDPHYRPDGGLAALRLTVALRAGGRLFATAGGGARFLSAERYAAVRGGLLHARRTPPDPAGRPAPALLGVARGGDVLIARRAGGFTVEPADLRQPFFFDHPSDHVPGMVLLEAARQAAAAASGGELLRPLNGRMAAVRFTEYEPAAVVEAVPHDRTLVFRVRQGGVATAYGVLGYGRHAV